jgi:hypothetical protein
MSEWIDAKQSPVPDEFTNVLITGFIENDQSNGRFYAVANYCGGMYYDPDTGDDYYAPTHWMTFPEVPA